MSFAGRCNEYLDLEQPFLDCNIVLLDEIIQKHHATFNADGNMGLVKLLKKQIIKRSIQKLTKTYLTVSIKDIAELLPSLNGVFNENENEHNTASPSAASKSTINIIRRFVLSMIREGDIFATINEGDGMIEFREDPEQYDSQQIIKNIDQVATKCL